MVKGKWWMTLGYGILIMLIILVISMIFAIPSMIYGFIQYRFNMMVKGVDEAFEMAMEGKDYIKGQYKFDQNDNMEIFKGYEVSQEVFIKAMKLDPS